MLPTAFAACVIQSFGPFILYSVLWLRHSTTLQMVALLAAFWCMLVISLVSIFTIGEAPPSHVVPIWLVAVALVTEMGRALLCVLVAAADRKFREHKQVLHSSRFRLVVLGAAMGFGWGLAHAVLTQSVLFESEQFIADDGAMLLLVNRCPQMDYLYWQSLASNAMTLFHIAATAIMLPAMVPVMVGEERGPRRRTLDILHHGAGASGNSSSGSLTLPTAITADEMATQHGPFSDDAANPAPQAAAASTSTVVNSAGGDRRPPCTSSGVAASSVVNASTDDTERLLPRAMRPLEPQTSLSRKGGARWVAAVVVLHLAMSLLSLLNGDVYNPADPASRGWRVGLGCAASLPLQFVVALTTCGGAAYVAHQDVLKKIPDDEI